MKPLRFFIAIALGCAITAQPAWCEDRIAIIFGNDAYQHADPLANAVNDARSVATLLENVLGFTLIKPPQTRENIWKDVGIKGFYAGLEAFKTASASAKIGLIYYAGHGVEVDGANYLLPVDAELAAASELRSQAVKVGEILADLKATGLPAKLLILDCCRNNPLPTRSWVRTRSTNAKGLAAIADTELPEATMILFSAGPGQEALDGEDGNSPFTAALVKELPQPGRSAFDAFLKVSDTVTAVTGRRQEPWLKFDGAGRTFRAFQFIGGAAPVTVPQDAEIAALKARLAEAERKAAAALAMNQTAPAKPPEALPVPVAAPTMSKPTTPLVLPAGSFGAAPANRRGFTNSLGMIFLPVPGTDVLFSVYETRVKDYGAYAAANSGVDMKWKDYEYNGHKQTDDHPVVNVSWEDAKAFCEWLSAKEGKIYRLPTDHEWSIAVGIGDREDPKLSPKEKKFKLADVYPWGSTWPPPKDTGNFSGTESASSLKLDDYTDSFPFTAPVGSFKFEHNGIKDLSGNVWEWCQDKYDPSSSAFVLRGGSWYDCNPGGLLSSYRDSFDSTGRSNFSGFRCVLVGAVAGGEAR